jgi:hypothetical protein
VEGQAAGWSAAKDATGHGQGSIQDGLREREGEREGGVERETDREGAREGAREGWEGGGGAHLRERERPPCKALRRWYNKKMNKSLRENICGYYYHWRKIGLLRAYEAETILLKKACYILLALIMFALNLLASHLNQAMDRCQSHHSTQVSATWTQTSLSSLAPANTLKTGLLMETTSSAKTTLQAIQLPVHNSTGNVNDFLHGTNWLMYYCLLCDYF